MPSHNVHATDIGAEDYAVGISQEVGNNDHPLEESFRIWSTLGLQYSITATPLAVGTYLASVIGVGGSPVFIYGYLLGVSLNICVCLCLAELASVYPHTSVQSLDISRVDADF